MKPKCLCVWLLVCVLVLRAATVQYENASTTWDKQTRKYPAVFSRVYLNERDVRYKQRHLQQHQVLRCTKKHHELESCILSLVYEGGFQRWVSSPIFKTLPTECLPLLSCYIYAEHCCHHSFRRPCSQTLKVVFTSMLTSNTAQAHW